MWCEDCKHPIEAWGFALRTTFFATPHIGIYVVRYICADRLLRTEPQVYFLFLSRRFHITNNRMSDFMSRTPKRTPNELKRVTRFLLSRPAIFQL
jgi:hypothetical protein